MQSILERLVHKIAQAKIDEQPDQNIYLEDVFNPAVYAEILARLPDEQNYAFIEHPDAVLPDGTKTRKLFSLSDQTVPFLKKDNQPFWHELNQVLVSSELQHALVSKFRRRIDERFKETLPKMANVPIFYRDFPGYRIGIHTDAPWKVITMQFYFPRDESQIHLGTSFHTRENGQFNLLKTNPFKPNSAYAFVRTEQSWHSVRQMAAHEMPRDSLALTIFLEDHEEYQKVLKQGHQRY